MQTISTIITTLSHHTPITLPMTPKSAAVMLILLTDEKNQIEIVITKRTAHLPTYAGHYSLPGGMRDDIDADFYATAVRELQEELNLTEDLYEKIGELDDFHDRYGHLVRPFVVFMKKSVFEKNMKIAAHEIENVDLLPLEKLDQIADDPALHAVTLRQPSYSLKENHIYVWGLTAAILVHFLNIISGHHKPLGKTIQTIA